MSKSTFNFHPETEATVEKLKKYFRAASKAEVLRRAIALLEMAMEVRQKGGEVAVVDKDNVVHKVLMS